MDLFLLKKIITVLVMPISIILILLFIALIFYWRKPTLSFTCMLIATLTLFLAAMPLFSDRVMAPLEDHFETFSRSSSPVDYIVILGCYHISDPKLPETSQLYPCSLQRLVEAIRIFRMHPEATIITSGSAFGQTVSNAETVKQAAISLGVPEEKILTENFPKDTEEEAQLIAPHVMGTNVVLITNANHMPRSIKYFQQYGINPIPAPAGYWVKGMNNEYKGWRYYTPSSHKLRQTTLAWYETLGRVVQWLKTLF